MREINRRSLLAMSGTFMCGAFLKESLGILWAAPPTEKDLWAKQEVLAKEAFAFWETFLKLRQGPDDDQPLDATYRERWLCLIRAVSWVESKHGTAGTQEPARDPMQCGNPSDSWWKSITAQSGNSDRIVRGPGLSNYWAQELPAAVASDAAFPADAKLTKLADAKKGHDDPAFNSTMSYRWGVVYLIHRTNTALANGRTYKCGVYAKTRLTAGAVAYNGGGDPNYGMKIAAALGGEIGCTLP